MTTAKNRFQSIVALIHVGCNERRSYDSVGKKFCKKKNPLVGIKLEQLVLENVFEQMPCTRMYLI